MEKILLRCSCGALLYSTNAKELARHQGHQFRYAQAGSLWEWFKLKVGIIRA